MTEAISLKQELCNMIGLIPEHKLSALRPLFDLLVKEEDDSHFLIETDLTDEERAIIAEGEKEYREHPENFTPWEKVRREA